MTVQAFLINSLTGETLQRMIVGSDEVFADAKFEDNQQIVILGEGAADINEIETYFDDKGFLQLRQKTVNIDLQLSIAKVEKKEAIKARRVVAEASGCLTPLGKMDSDPESQRKVNGSVTMALIAIQNSWPFSIAWTMANNEIVDHDAPAMIGAGLAVGQYVAACHKQATILKELVSNAHTLDELDAIDIEKGWPE